MLQMVGANLAKVSEEAACSQPYVLLERRERPS